MSFNSQITPVTYNLSLVAGASHTITFSGVATYCRIDVEDQAVTVALNSSADAMFLMADNSVVEFRNHDLHLTSIDFHNTISGASTASILVIAGVQV